MDFIVVILFLIVAILAYILYFYFYKSTEIVSDLRSLNSTVSIPAVQITSPTADIVYYELWLYLNNEPATQQIIFSHGKMALTIDKQTLSVYSIASPTDKTLMQTATTVFPIQKWMYIVIVRKSDLLETYLNGKLVKTAQLSIAQKTKIDTSDTDGIIVGNTQLNGYMTKFNRKPEPIEASEVWNKYIQGNGVPSSTATMKNYEAGVEITQNKQSYGYYKLF